MNSNPEAWRKLKVGDRVRIVRIPSFFSDPNCHVPDAQEVLGLYHTLIDLGIVLEIDEIDELGHPWISYDLTNDDGEGDCHGLALDDDSWELAEP
jgi:hypothetical protein